MERSKEWLMNTDPDDVAKLETRNQSVIIYRTLFDGNQSVIMHMTLFDGNQSVIMYMTLFDGNQSVIMYMALFDGNQSLIMHMTVFDWLVVLGFNATLTAEVISWRLVTHMCFLAFSHQY